MQGLLDLVFPPRCAGCDRPGRLLCEECACLVPRVSPGRACARCGAPADDACAECGETEFAFIAARCAALLAPPVSRAVVLLKDGGERRYANLLASLLAEVALGWLAADDVIVPVPASPGAVRRRGFDHAVDIARALSKMTDARLAYPLVARATADQRALNREGRFANRSQAFAIAAAAPGHPRVVLLDDVFTTGATLDAAARTLIAHGTCEVRALAVARAVTDVHDTVNNRPPPATLQMLSPGSVVADVSAS